MLTESLGTPFTVKRNNQVIGDGAWRRGEDGAYICDWAGLRVDVKVETFRSTGVVRQTNTITNTGSEPVLLNAFSSAKIRTEKGLIGVDRNRWQAEAQWNFFTAEQCGMVPASCHEWERETYVIDSVGSWSTGVFYPLTMVVADKKTYYMEIEGAHNWRLTHSVTRGKTEYIYALEATSADEENGGWTFTLNPGESYTTQPVVYGVVDGGFEEAARELTAYKRETSLVHFKDNVIPVVFNDYMNCLWGLPSDTKLIPLIDAAAEAGCEYFCIDAGWHKNADGSIGTSGDWLAANERFGEGGLQKVFDHMKAKGLVPGVWFELDNVNPKAFGATLDDDCVLKRFGKTIPRNFYNFRCEKVRKYLESRIDELYSMGVRYIKNDYNQSTGIGCDDAEGIAPAEGLIRNYEAFSSFIDDVRAKHPDLIIENCGSGACRADNGTLKHFFLQSTSDQEYYFWNPSIIVGSAPHFTPEKSGIWAYPFACPYDERNDKLDAESFGKRFEDGEETIFNMVNGMCGNLYQSGRIDLADEYNLSLIKEGIAAYKRMRGDIVRSHHIAPNGTFLIGEELIASGGLMTDDGSHAYLAVWRVGGDTDTAKIDLSKYGFKKASVWYPEKTEFSFENDVLEVKLPKKYSARMILLEK